MDQTEQTALLPRLSGHTEQTVDFSTAVRGYRPAEVDAFVARVETEMADLRAQIDRLETALAEAESRIAAADNDAMQWRRRYEQSTPPFEELGARIGQMLALAEKEAQDRRDAAVTKAKNTLDDADRRAKEKLDDADRRAKEKLGDADRRAREARDQAERRAKETVSSAESRARDLTQRAEEDFKRREAESRSRVEALEQEHDRLLQQLTQIRATLSQIPGLAAVQATKAPQGAPPAVATTQPGETKTPDQPGGTKAADKQETAVLTQVRPEGSKPPSGGA